ncbi:estradiol 17-beta-dehydrogenase 11 isoform X2 [Arctopsyche grandis]|uniref:estradiol 17-beta-dehydrogenase 11 isoform X2 n=1 Tax=Arctopsyche grandis TaxID=121162 RepID=UPI00406D7AB8
MAQFDCDFQHSSASVDETHKLVTALGGRCHSYVVDLADRNEVYKVADKVREDCGSVSLLINNAGLVSGKTFLETPDHLIQKTFDVNILAHFWTTKAFLPEMVKANEGHLVTIASLAGHVGVPKLVDYCSSKFAAVGFDEALRAELEAMGIDGVRTTAICPFFIRSTGMFEDVHSRFVSPLNLNEVADRIVLAIRGSEKFVIIPGYLQLMLALKWMFPWGCVSGFLRRLVPDAMPEHGSAPVKLAPSVPVVESNGSNGSAKMDSQMPFKRTPAMEREP